LKSVEPGRWRRTSPFAILFFFGKLLKTIAQNAWQSLAPLAAFVYAYEGELVTKVAFGVIGFFAIATTVSVLNYWFFRYQLNDDSILIRQGIVKKKQLDIKFDRIQGLNTQQNIVFRYFGLVTVHFDTAGSAGNEGNLPAVTRQFADSLRSRIGDRPGSGTVDAQSSDADPLVRLDWRDMIRIGIADRRALVVLAVLSPVIERLGDNVDTVIASYAEDAATGLLQFGVVTGVIFGLAIAFGLVVILAVISVAAAFLRYHNFELFLNEDTLRSLGGLLTQHEMSMHLGKIQTLRLEQGIVMRSLDRYRLTARQARSSHKQDKLKNFIVPVVTAAQANHLRELLMAPEGDALMQIPTSDEFTAISPYYMRSRILFVGLLPTIVWTALFWQLAGPVSLGILLWFPASILLAYQSWRRAGYLCSEEGLVRRSGVVGYRSVALLYRKVQRVTVTESRYQRRKGLASVRVYMASGSVRIPYIEHATAKQLRDYILYKVESSQQAWH
jgi:putative membrane protein